MSFVENLDRAASVAICSWLSDGGSAALGAAVVGAVAIPGGQVPALAAGLGILALNYGCQFDPTTAIPPGVDQGFCRETAGGTVGFEHYGSNGVIKAWSRNHLRIESITVGDTPTQVGVYRYKLHATSLDGSPFFWTTSRIEPGDYYKVVTSNGQCSDYGGPVTPAPLPPITYQGGDAECDIEVVFEGWVVGEDGNVRPVMKMSSAAPAALASGGVISGCNFSPVIYSPAPPGGGGGGGCGGGGGGGCGEPPWFAPWAPGPDGPDGAPLWLPLLRGAAAGVTGALVGKAVEELLDKLFPKQLPGVTYRLESVCEVNAQGEPISEAVVRAIPALPLGEGIDARLRAIVDIAQGLKYFKQPVCESRRFIGEPVTVNFVSTEDSPNGTRPLRKEFRYRDQSFADVCAHANHWAGFSWNSGPVQVISKGLAWGQVQVWAESADEGKRVIAHAAAIAGVDLTDPKHSLVTGAATNPRYGVSLTMVPAMLDQRTISVSKRDGPSGVPVYPTSG